MTAGSRAVDDEQTPPDDSKTARAAVSELEARYEELSRQAQSVGEELAETRAALAEQGARNMALHAQLESVGAELAETRAVLAQSQAAYQSLLSSMRSPDDRPSSAAAAAYRDRSALILLPHVIDLLPPDETVVIVDVGAREVDRDPRWRPFPQRRLRFYGFEPDAPEAERLNQLRRDSDAFTEFYAAGLWSSTGTLTFRHNNIPGGSSFLPQHHPVTDRWKFENPTQETIARDMFREVGSDEIDVITLDEWARRAGVGRVDFVKLNVQGGELEVLRGAESVLDGVLGILVEVAFVESYTARPFFTDIDAFLRRAGFTFFDLLAHHYVGRADSPVAAQHLSIVDPKLGQLTSSWGQLIEGHALYLRDPIGAGGAAGSVDTTLKLAAIAEAFGQVEFAFELLEWLRRSGDGAPAPVMQRLPRLIERATEEYRRHLRPDVPQ
jgi:FkbM family methyltransferase